MTARAAVDLLQKARKRIEAERDTYICDALMHSSYPGSPTVRYLRRYIIQQLDGREGASLGSWLVCNQNKRYPLRYLDHPGADTLRLCRLAWIDKMIDSLNTTGKLP